MYVTTGISLITATNSENGQHTKVVENSIFVLMQRESRHELGIFVRSVRVRVAR